MHTNYIYGIYMVESGKDISSHWQSNPLVHMITWCKLCSLHSIKTTPPHIILQPMHQVAGY